MTEPHTTNLSSPLSEREIEILRLVATGATNQQIAVQLDISIHTVKVHMRNILSKTGTASRTEASLYAIRAGIIQLTSGVPAEPDVSPLPSVKTTEMHRMQTVAAPSLTLPAEPLPPLPVEPPAHLPAPVVQQRGEAGGELLPSIPSQPLRGVRDGDSRPYRRAGWFRRLLLLPWSLVALLVLVALVSSVTWLVTSALPLSPMTTAPLPVAPATATPEDDTWAPRAALPETRVGFGMTEYDGKVYVIGGRDSGGVSAYLERYNPQSDTWARLASKPTPVTDIQAVAIGGVLYVPGGELATGAISDELAAYDVVRDRWLTLSPLPAPRSQYVAVSVDGKLYLFGGWDGQSYQDNVWMYDPDEAMWQERTAMPDARGGMSAAVADNQIHLLGGHDAKGPLALHQAYHPVQDNGIGQPWSALPPLPEPLTQLAAAKVINSIYVFFPERAGLFIYDIEQETWNSFTTELPASSTYISAVLLGSSLHLVGNQAPDDAGFHIVHRVIYRTQLPIVPR